MKIFRNSIIPFRGFSAINLFGVMFIRRNVRIDEVLLRHEEIHTLQMRELGYIFFYILYVLEWLWRLLRPGNAYRNISFEREAYLHQYDQNYPAKRKSYAQWRHG